MILRNSERPVSGAVEERDRGEQEHQPRESHGHAATFGHGDALRKTCRIWRSRPAAASTGGPPHAAPVRRAARPYLV
jgi:hypothetical protein